MFARDCPDLQAAQQRPSVVIERDWLQLSAVKLATGNLSKRTPKRSSTPSYRRRDGKGIALQIQEEFLKCRRVSPRLQGERSSPGRMHSVRTHRHAESRGHYQLSNEAALAIARAHGGFGIGFGALVAEIKAKLRSIALPRSRCGNGGLDWALCARPLKRR